MNIEARELRIGNWIFSKTTNGPFRVSLISLDAIESNPGMFEPIAITEEWLLRFGFERADTVFRKNEFLYDLNTGHFYIDQTGYEIQYVHQLQNLYFALTGEELHISQSHA